MMKKRIVGRDYMKLEKRVKLIFKRMGIARPTQKEISNFIGRLGLQKKIVVKNAKKKRVVKKKTRKKRKRY